MAKIIACTQIDEKPVYINLDNLPFIGEGGDGRADFKFVSDVSLKDSRRSFERDRVSRAHHRGIGEATLRTDAQTAAAVDGGNLRGFTTDGQG